MKGVTLILLAPMALASVSFTADPPPRYSEPKRLGVVTDARLPEVSGILAVSNRPGYYWVHNDSGDQPRILAVNERGEVVAVVHVRGAAATDWEDIARGPGPVRAGETRDSPCLFLADTGNNRRDRKELVVWRLREPELPLNLTAKAAAETTPEVKLEAEPAVPVKFRYPGTPRDCEAIVVHPQTGHIYLLTKDLWSCWVYRIDGNVPAGAPTQGALEVAEMPRSMVTAADLSADGRKLVVRTYLEVQLYLLPRRAPFEDVFSQIKINLPRSILETQGEAICFDADGSIVTVSESKPIVIHRITPLLAEAQARNSETKSSP